MRAARLFPVLATMLFGCSAVLGVKDIYFEENGPGGGNPEGGLPDGTIVSEGGEEAGECVGENFQISPQHCGRCNHSCLGGECTGGKCSAVQIGQVAGGPLEYVAVSNEFVFASSDISLLDDVGGIWRVPKTGGTAVEFVTDAVARFAEQMTVVGEVLYFVVNEASGAGGGLWSCPVAAAPPCTPTLIQASDEPPGVTKDSTGKIYYGEPTSNELRLYTPDGGAPTVFRAGYGGYYNMVVEGTAAFYTSNFVGPNNVLLWEINPNLTENERGRYESQNATPGHAAITNNAAFFAAWEFFPPTGGVVRRFGRNAGVAPCDYGGTTNKNPYGIAVDDARIYWTNQGDTGTGTGGRPPFTANASVATCEIGGCCATPEILWTGNSMPRGILTDQRGVYFVSHNGGQIWKVAKP